MEGVNTAGVVSVAVGALTAVTATAATYYLASQPEPNSVPAVDLNNQSDILEDESRCSRLMPKGQLTQYLNEDMKTLHECFLRGLQISRNDPCLGARTGPNLEYEWITYQEVYDRSHALGSWMVEQGIKPKTETMIGIYSQNRIEVRIKDVYLEKHEKQFDYISNNICVAREWTVTSQACAMFSIVPVALYDTLGEDGCAYIINQTEMSLIVCDTKEKANFLIKESNRWQNLREIVVVDGFDGVNKELAETKNIKVISFSDALKQGKENLKAEVPPDPEDIAFICYTSGTTGDPKGAIMTHESVMVDLSACLQVISTKRPYRNTDVEICYLPLAHMYERIGQLCMFSCGGRIGFFRGDPKLLVEDLQALKPTVLPMVPRLLNRVYDKVKAGISGSKLKTKLFEWALASKQKELKQYVIRRNSIWDKLVFHKIQNLFGGRVDFMVSASAPIERKVMDFFRCSLGCTVIEAYGQTENSAGMTMTIPGDFDAGHVGPPLPCNVVKLIDAPSVGYYAKDGQGEIVAKGNNMFKGYYKNPEKTAEALDNDGWLHTGDIGEWLPNGSLKIIDRCKNIFKLAQGEYVAPEKIEVVFMRSKYVAQAFVEGDSLQAFIMCAVVPDEEVLMEWAKNNALNDSFEELCKNETIKDMILTDINKIGRSAGLMGFELARDILLHPELFSVENDLMTPTFKNKRPALRKYFQQQIAHLYRKHEFHRQTSMQ